MYHYSESNAVLLPPSLQRFNAFVPDQLNLLQKAWGFSPLLVSYSQSPHPTHPTPTPHARTHTHTHYISAVIPLVWHYSMARGGGRTAQVVGTSAARCSPRHEVTADVLIRRVPVCLCQRSAHSASEDVVYMRLLGKQHAAKRAPTGVMCFTRPTQLPAHYCPLINM